MIVNITKDNFEKEVIQSEIPVMGYFQLTNWAKCVVFKSFGEGLEKQNPDKVKLAIFDITKTQSLVKTLGVKSTPSFVIFKDGQELERFYGDGLIRDNIEDFVSKVVQWKNVVGHKWFARPKSVEKSCLPLKKTP